MADMTYAETVGLFRDCGYELCEMSSGANRLAVCPAMAGRIVAASVAGEDGYNPFFVNPVDVKGGPEAEKLIFRGGLGGRDWLGPEGCGDMSFYFRKAPLVFENWCVDERQSLMQAVATHADKGRVVTSGEFHVRNLRGKAFDVAVEQEMLFADDCQEALGVAVPDGARYLGFRRATTYTNIGQQGWGDDYGCAMIWFVLMLRGGDDMFVVVPFNDGAGPGVEDYRFDDKDIPADRLIRRVEKGYALFKADGQCRGKIGVKPGRATGFVYGLDLEREFMTMLRYSVEDGAGYLNNLWTEDAQTEGGNVLDAYNNLDSEPILPGRFCELETVSPCLRLGPGDSYTLKTATAFFQGPRAVLEQVIKGTSGCDLGAETFVA